MPVSPMHTPVLDGRNQVANGFQFIIKHRESRAHFRMPVGVAATGHRTLQVFRQGAGQGAGQAGAPADIPDIYLFISYPPPSHRYFLFHFVIVS